jgi:hypothetical protein
MAGRTQNNAHHSDWLQRVFVYHQAIKHQFQAYASGPGYLDWVNQPGPFRRYAAARLKPVDVVEPTDKPGYDDIFISDGMPAPRSSMGRRFPNCFATALRYRHGRVRARCVGH